MSKKTRAIFTETELYNLCLAEVDAMERKDKTGYDFDWSECVPSYYEDYEEKFDNLSLSEQNYFNDRLKEVARNLKNDFENLPDNIQTNDDLSYLTDCKRQLSDKVSYYLEEFLIEED